MSDLHVDTLKYTSNTADDIHSPDQLVSIAKHQHVLLQNKQLQSSLTELDHLLEQTAKKEVQKQRRIDTLDLNVKQLNHSLQAAHANEQALNGRIHSLETEIVSLQTTVQHEQADKAYAQQQIVDLQSQLSLAQQKYNGIKQDMAKMNTEYTSHRERLLELESLLEDTCKRDQLKTTRLQSLEQELSLIQAEHSKLMSTQVSQKTKFQRLQTIEETLTQLQQKLMEATAKYEDEHTLAIQYKGKLDVATGRITELEQKREQSNKRRQAVEVAVQELQDRYTVEAAEKARLQAQLQKVRLELTHQYMNEKQQLEAGFEAQTGQLQQRIHQLEQQNVADAHRLQNLIDQQTARKAAVQTDLTNTNNKLETVNGQYASLQKEFNNVSESKIMIENQLNKQQAIVNDLKQQLASVEATHLANLTDVKASFDCQLSAAQDQIQAAQAKTDAANAQISTLQQSLSSSEAELNAMSVQYSSHDQMTKLHNDTITTLQQQILEYKATVAALQEAHDSTKQQSLTAYAETLQQYSEIRNDLTHKLAEAESAVSDHQATIQTLQTQIDNHGSENTRLSRLVAEQNSKLASIQQNDEQIVQLNATIETMRRQHRDEIEQLTAALEQHIQQRTAEVVKTYEAKILNIYERHNGDTAKLNSELSSAAAHQTAMVETRITELTAVHDSAVAEYITQITNLQQQLADKQSAEHTYADNMGKLQQHIEQAKLDNAALIDKHQVELASVEQRQNETIAAINFKNLDYLAELQASHKSAIQRIQASHNSMIAQLNDAHASRIKDLEFQIRTTSRDCDIQYAFKLKQVEYQHNDALQKLRDQHYDALKIVEDKHVLDRQQLETMHTLLRKQSSSEIEVISQQHQNELKQLTDNHALKLKQVDERHQADMGKMLERNAAECERIKQQAKNAIEKLRNDHREELSKLHTQIEQQAVTNSTNIDEAVSKHKNQIAILQLKVNELSALTSRGGSSSETVDLYKNEIIELNAKLTEMTSLKMHAEEQLAKSAEEFNSDKHSLLQRSGEIVESLQSETKGKMEAMEQMTTEISQLQRDLKRKNKYLEQIQTQHNQQYAALYTTHETSVQQHDQVVHELKAQIDELKHQMNTHECGDAVLTVHGEHHNNESVDALQAEVIALKQRQQEKMTQLYSEMKLFTDESQAEIAELKHTISQLQFELHQKENELAAAQSAGPSTADNSRRTSSVQLKHLIIEESKDQTGDIDLPVSPAYSDVSSVKSPVGISDIIKQTLKHNSNNKNKTEKSRKVKSTWSIFSKSTPVQQL